MIYDQDEVLSSMLRLVLKHDNVAVGSAVLFAIIPAMKYSLSQMPKRAKDRYMQCAQEFIDELLNDERGYDFHYRNAVADLMELLR